MLLLLVHIALVVLLTNYSYSTQNSWCYRPNPGMLSPNTRTRHATTAFLRTRSHCRRQGSVTSGAQDTLMHRGSLWQSLGLVKGFFTWFRCAVALEVFSLAVKAYSPTGWSEGDRRHGSLSMRMSNSQRLQNLFIQVPR